MLNELFILTKIKEGDIKAIPLFAGMPQALRGRWKLPRK